VHNSFSLEKMSCSRVSGSRYVKFALWHSGSVFLSCIGEQIITRKGPEQDSDGFLPLCVLTAPLSLGIEGATCSKDY
jgi:hypothetical protein